MTEEDAKTKWCPFARLGETGATYNRCGPAANLECIGSACMAWRWDEEGNLDREEHYNATAGDIPNNGPPKSVGYCGLAGKP